MNISCSVSVIVQLKEVAKEKYIYTFDHVKVKFIIMNNSEINVRCLLFYIRLILKLLSSNGP